MKYRMSFGPLKTGLIVFIILVCIAIILLDICMLAGVMEIDVNAVPVVGVSLAAMIIVFIGASMLLLNSFYRFDDDKLIAVLGFFCDKLIYENIEQIKFNTKDNVITLIYNSPREQDGIQSIRMNLNPSIANKVADELRVKCPEVIVETYEPKPKDKKKK